MDEDELREEVADLSQPYVARSNCVTLFVIWPGLEGRDDLVEELVEEAAAACRQMLLDYGKPDAQVVVARGVSPRDPLERETGVLVTVDEVTAEFIHDSMLGHLAPAVRKRLDAAGRASVKVPVWNDGMSDWF